MRVAGGVIGLITAMLIAATIVNRISLAAGPGLAGTSLLAVGVAYAAAWFTVSLLLPRATSDPSTLFPGAALASVLNAVIWERFGSIATLVFGLPGLRRLAGRPTITRFFDLDPTRAEQAASKSAPSSADD